VGIKSFLSNILGLAKPEAPAENEVSNVRETSCKETGTKSREDSADITRQSDGHAVSLDNIVNFVEYVVKSLVDYTDEVTVTCENKDGAKQINIRCRQSDRGKIIGKKGKTIIALRALAAGVAGRLQDRVLIEVLDDEDEGKDKA